MQLKINFYQKKPIKKMKIKIKFWKKGKTLRMNIWKYGSKMDGINLSVISNLENQNLKLKENHLKLKNSKMDVQYKNNEK